MHALRHRVVHHSVDPDRGQSQCQGCKQARQQGREAHGGRGALHIFRHRADLGDCQLRLALVQLLADGPRQRQRVHARADHEAQVAADALLKGNVDLRPYLLGEGVISHVFDHAHDLSHHGHDAILGEVLRFHSLAHRIFSGPRVASQQLIDNHYLGAAGAVLAVEHPAGQEARAHGFEVAGSDAAMIGHETAGFFFQHSFWTVGTVPVGIVIQGKMRMAPMDWTPGRERTRSSHCLTKLGKPLAGKRRPEKSTSKVSSWADSKPGRR